MISNERNSIQLNFLFFIFQLHLFNLKMIFINIVYYKKNKKKSFTY